MASKQVTSPALSTNKHLLRWVEKMADLTRPAAIHWVDGSQQEYDALCVLLEERGTFTRLNQNLWPGCFYARSDRARCRPRGRAHLYLFALPRQRRPHQ